MLIFELSQSITSNSDSKIPSLIRVQPIQVTQAFDEKGRQATSESSSGTDMILNINYQR